MRAKAFRERQKIRLGSLQAVRAEMCVAYRAWAKGELTAEDYRAGTLGLVRIASLDQGQMLDERVRALEQRLVDQPAPRTSNGTASYAAARP